MVKIIKKTFNFQSLFGRNGFGKTNFGSNSPKFYNASTNITPEIVYVIDITTPAQIIHKDISSIDIEFTTLNIENFNVYYKINSGDYNFVEEIDYDESPYTLDLSSIELVDNDILTVKFANDLAEDSVAFTAEQPYITITSSGGEHMFNEDIDVLYNWNDVDLIDVYYQINSGSEVLYESDIVPDGSYTFNTASVEFENEDILTIILKDATAPLVNDNINYTIICTSLEITSINNGDPVILEGYYDDGERYMASTSDEIVPVTDPDTDTFQVGYGNADGQLELEMGEVEVEMAIGTVTIDSTMTEIPLDTATTFEWTAEDIDTIDIYGNDVLLANDVDATLGTYDITLDSGDFSESESVTITIRNNSSYEFDSLGVTAISGSSKYQITTEDCEFSATSQVLVPSTTKLAVHGYTYNHSTAPKINGVALPSGKTYIHVVMLIDLSDGSVDWLKYHTDTTTMISYNKIGQTIAADSNYVYCVVQGDYTTNNSDLYFNRISIDGTSDTISVVKSDVQSYGNESICQSGNYVYISYRNTTAGNTQIFNINKTGWVVGSNMNTGRAGAYNNALFTDDSYVYFACLHTSYTVAQVIRYNLITLLGSTLVASNSPVAPNTKMHMAGAISLDYSGTDYILLATADGTGTTNTDNPEIIRQRNLVEQDNTTNVSGTPYIANDKIFVRKTSGSIYAGSNLLTELYLIDKSTLSTTTWNVDYSANTVAGLIGVVYDGTDYWMVGLTTGDFDGNNSGNTARNLIYAKIDITDGSIM